MRLLTTLLLLAVAAPLAAQEREIRSANLPPALERELIRMYEGDARRYDGEVTVSRMEVIRGDVAAMGGPFRVAGRVMGDLAMVNGDVIIEPGGSVTGDVTVVGGEVRLGDDATVAGTITAYGTSSRNARVRDAEDEDDDVDWEWGDRDDGDWWPRRRDRRDRGYSRLTVRAGASYNRVEGLPIMFGPVIRTAGSNPLRLEALAIWRSEPGTLDTDRMGYQVRAEQFLGGGRLSVGASAFSVVDPLDRWQLSDLEASLATAVLHDDYRDHYGRTGWTAFVGLRPVRALEARVEYRREEHEALSPGDPWSLFHRGDAWRLQPLVAEGELETISGSLTLDLRDDRRRPRRGWYGRLAVEQPVDGSLTRPALFQALPIAVGDDPSLAPGGLIPEAAMSTDFTSLWLDLRRYNAVGYRSQLNLRVVAGGNVDERPLPPQYQHALGGVGSLPGFPTFHADCGARSAAGARGMERFFPSYGCDRFVLGQIEYRGDLSLSFGFGEPDYEDDDWWDYVDVDLSPTWVVFFDAGRGWGYDDPVLGADRDTGTLMDAGLGFLIEELGIYAALPLNGGVSQEPRFFIRLGRRF